MTATEERTALRIEHDAWACRDRWPYVYRLPPREVQPEIDRQYGQATANDSVATVRYLPGPGEGMLERDFVLVGLAASLFKAKWEETATLHDAFYPAPVLIVRDPDGAPGELFRISSQHLVQILPKG